MNLRNEAVLAEQATTGGTAAPSALWKEDLQSGTAQARRKKLRPLIVSDVDLAEGSELETDISALWRSEYSTKKKEAPSKVCGSDACFVWGRVGGAPTPPLRVC